ncbi:restriction endonuclease subunit R [Anabaena cylindrica FACHB-243]|uniref:Restriction endonuclease, type I, EcoRI, R subunit/Type III n=1 Tax=Anabaena cylindrica (strain ATCC 27899 / PCC 7122) TaxID=272123 RepID=K9ZDT7_ANACC|nr:MULTISPECIES: type I restriction enzyme HsdR N-terminal domain-containing protein [Anabaena]AFZ56737.1 Restriction endonuclease, type I, EcoRI, R subunit/Type III [Anabaena cylindrica PCC 7122]MBD2420331.1 restriction endonuclease subunit R [Anabaena cylindrica FACHB-243]MBY5283039.1 restriction endonuclease subunit R [Anabaena sp. CCAP 1446/1C]MBY5306644.1 restriction endonuclease subunit R [Anabaena sp. CCAP 1446/1C]MCM2407856.1 type I restriction enzyme HsdR N-terminal domain-containing 
MVQSIADKDVTLRELKQNFGIQIVQDATFFPEWLDGLEALNGEEQHLLDRVKANFLELMDDPPMLENTVKMVVLAPLLDLAGFYHKPFRIETETGVALEMEDEGTIIRGRIDVLVLKNRLWLLVIESKRSDFAVTRAIPQALAYMLGNEETVLPTFGMITNGNEFLFLKVLEHKYANSRLFSLVNPDNELYSVLQVLKRLGMEAIAFSAT